METGCDNKGVVGGALARMGTKLWPDSGDGTNLCVHHHRAVTDPVKVSLTT